MSAPHEIAARIRMWEDHGPQGPMTLELYPTLSCNLDCAFCDTTDRHRAPVNELSTERLIEIVDEGADDRAYIDLAQAKHIDGMIILTPRTTDVGAVGRSGCGCRRCGAPGMPMDRSRRR